MTVSVLLCDEQTVVLAGLRTILDQEPDLCVVGEARDPREAAELARDLHPNIVLLGLSAEDRNLATTVNEVSSDAGHVSLPVVALVASERQNGLLDALRMGVRGVVDKASPPSELVRAIQVIAAGEVALSPSITSRVVEWAIARTPIAADLPAAVRALSTREIEVLKLLAQGALDDEVGQALHVAKATVRYHVHNLLGKLGLRSRSQAVAYAYQHGILTDSPNGDDEDEPRGGVSAFLSGPHKGRGRADHEPTQISPETNRG